MTDSTNDVDWYDPELGDDGELLDAVSWAHHKLLAFGVGNSERDALMLDRLKLYIEAGD